MLDPPDGFRVQVIKFWFHISTLKCSVVLFLVTSVSYCRILTIE